MTLVNRAIILIIVLISLSNFNVSAEAKKFNMVFVPASEKGDENDYVGLIKIVNKITGFEINFIKVTDYKRSHESR